MKRNTRFVLVMVCMGLFMMIVPSKLNAAGALDEINQFITNEPAQYHFFNSKEEFAQALRAYAPNYQYLWVYRTAATMYISEEMYADDEELALAYSQKGNLFTCHGGNNIEYCILCSNSNPGYLGVRQFYNNQVDEAHSYLDSLIGEDLMQALWMLM